MVRYLLCLLITCSATLLRADDLSGRLRMLYPGEDAEATLERAYLAKKLDNLFLQLSHHDRVERGPVHKQVERIQERFVRELLLTYDARAGLTDAFRSGSYNDATATLLYALTLEKYNIPYEAHVDHWESYLTVDPQGKRTIALHSPGTRTHTPAAERGYRREYLSLLRTVHEEDIAQLSPAAADQLFYRFYYRPAQRLSFRQLSAYAQFRRAQHAFTRADYTSAIADLHAAWLLDDRQAFLMYRRAVELQQSSLSAPDVTGYVDDLFTRWREDSTNRYLPAALLRHFDDRQQLLLTQDQPDKARHLLTTYCTRDATASPVLSRDGPAPATAWCDELKQLQHLRFLAHYQSRGEYVQALHLAEALLAEQPQDAQRQAYVAELTLVHLRQTTASPEELVTQARAAALRYPFLLQHDRYADIVLRQTALRVRDLFAQENVAAGQLELVHFRKQLRDIPNGYDRKLWTLTAFVAASNYYFAERDYAPARAYIEEALGHDPTNDFLLHQQDLLRRY
ncbi:hypothetical protein LEM8419_03146 [Neolewinella maritima]|uniref:Tetratricopeptide repeat protein n=1 Tax=Neolewinella maritima TaxID=1383882 RepID=A0ABN8FAE2_9BACT|nr:hypothetical protein [Neolewinella maritima]CAH1002229.1 hypothetical protein LEM8419_03146 [Neolewinella maritima]